MSKWRDVVLDPPPVKRDVLVCFENGMMAVGYLNDAGLKPYWCANVCYDGGTNWCSAMASDPVKWKVLPEGPWL